MHETWAPPRDPTYCAKSRALVTLNASRILRHDLGRLGEAGAARDPLRLPRAADEVPLFVATLLPPHRYVVGAEPAVRDARLVLVDAARRLLTTGLFLLGIKAPERM